MKCEIKMKVLVASGPLFCPTMLDL